MNLDDAIRQARDARANPYAPYVCEDALRDLLTALDDTLPHLIDTRRLAALGVHAALRHDGRLRKDPWEVWAANGLSLATCFGATPAEALAAAEREAGL